jgi:hypothetical protein
MGISGGSIRLIGLEEGRPGALPLAGLLGPMALRPRAHVGVPPPALALRGGSPLHSRLASSAAIGGSHMRIVRVLAAMLVAGCAPQAQRSDGGAAAITSVAPVVMNGFPQANDSYTGSVPFLGRTVPLPEGTWTVLVTQGLTLNKVGLVAATMALIRHDGPMLRGIIQIGGNTRPFPRMPVNTVCTSSDVIWNDVREAIANGRQDCTAITFQRPVLWREQPKSFGYEIEKSLDALGIQAPNIMVMLVIHESSARWFIGETLYANPDLEGITPDMSTQRSQSAWTAFNLPRDPRKQQFIDKLKAQAGPLRAALRQQIDGPPPYVPASGLTPA